MTNREIKKARKELCEIQKTPQDPRILQNWPANLPKVPRHQSHFLSGPYFLPRAEEDFCSFALLDQWDIGFQFLQGF